LVGPGGQQKGTDEKIMADRNIEWIVIFSGPYKIGAVGFLGNTAAVVVSFYDDRDFDHSGKVSFGEKVGSFLYSLTPLPKPMGGMSQVMYLASFNPDIINRDLDFARDAQMNYWSEIESRVTSAYYALYIGNQVSEIAGAIAGRVASNVVAKYVIRKGLESAVKAAFGVEVAP
jgi:hypothetical protein